MNTDILDVELAEEDGKIEIESVSKLKYCILFFASLGIYSTWWMYKVWKKIKEEKELDIMPVARALFSILFMYGLFEKIKETAIENAYTKSYSSGFLFALFIIMNALSNLPDPLWLLTFFGVLSFLQPLEAYNFSIENSENYKLKLRDGFSTRQTVLIIIGAIIWILILLGLFLPESFNWG